MHSINETRTSFKSPPRFLDRNVLDGHARCQEFQIKSQVGGDQIEYRQCVHDVDHYGPCEYGPWIPIAGVGEQAKP